MNDYMHQTGIEISRISSTIIAYFGYHLHLMIIHIFIAPTSTKTTYKMYVSFKLGPKTHTHEKRVPFCSCLDGWVTALRCEFVLWTTRVCFLTALHVIDVSLTHIIACG
eukprot:7965_1